MNKGDHPLCGGRVLTRRLCHYLLNLGVQSHHNPPQTPEEPIEVRPVLGTGIRRQLLTHMRVRLHGSADVNSRFGLGV